MAPSPGQEVVGAPPVRLPRRRLLLLLYHADGLGALYGPLAHPPCG
jgi:hypothetical protein